MINPQWVIVNGEFVVEDKNDWLKPVASHGPDGGGGQLVRTFP